LCELGPGAVAVLAACGLGAAGACKHEEMASVAQCEKLYDRFVDLELSEDPRAPAMSSEDRAHLRAKIASDALDDADVQQVRKQCTTEVTEGEYKCAIAATSSRAWNDCIQ
jgi:hypothetical protein